MALQWRFRSSNAAMKTPLVDGRTLTKISDTVLLSGIGFDL